MQHVKFADDAPTTSLRPAPVRASSSRPKIPMPSQRDDLDTLVATLSNADPAFGDLLTKTRQDLAPLAETREGRVTLTSLRLRAGLTQTQLAEKVGQKQSNISLYESGSRTDMKRDTMRTFCAALGCDMNTLDEALENSAQMPAQHTNAA